MKSSFKRSFKSSWKSSYKNSKKFRGKVRVSDWWATEVISDKEPEEVPEWSGLLISFQVFLVPVGVVLNE